MFIQRRGRGGYLRRCAAGNDPTSSLYPFYHSIVTDDTILLRNEVEDLFNRSSWAVRDIPDPKDEHAQRYATLAVLPALMIRPFNRLISRGLPRDSPVSILESEEAESRARPIILEELPAWTERVPKLEVPRKIPDADGKSVTGPEDEKACKEFLDKGISIAKPHIYFV
ncbi:MAG: hypothetical protein M1818_001351 [Claussenomyces sp. TS43310]|nr:MAG: hypothetical protein M1818_001351 [Claussenomyces sp. TS43310]